MDKAKVIKRVNNLKKIKGIVEIAKFDTLQKLTKAKEIKDHHYKMAELSSEVINFARSKYRIASLINRKTHEKKVKGTLWVYVTMTSNLIKTSYEHFDHMIASGFNPEFDKLIVVGKPAIKFAKKRKYDVLLQEEDIEHSIKNVAAVLNESLTNKLFSKILVVANTRSIKNEPFKLYPLKEIDKEKKKAYTKTKFYFSIVETIINISASYVENTLSGIYQEAYINFYKEKLVRHEGSLKNIDERVAKLKSEINKIHRKEETEEMIQVTQMTKRK